MPLSSHAAVRTRLWLSFPPSSARARSLLVAAIFLYVQGVRIPAAPQLPASPGLSACLPEESRPEVFSHPWVGRGGGGAPIDLRMVCGACAAQCVADGARGAMLEGYTCVRVGCGSGGGFSLHWTLRRVPATPRHNQNGAPACCVPLCCACVSARGRTNAVWLLTPRGAPLPAAVERPSPRGGQCAAAGRWTNRGGTRAGASGGRRRIHFARELPGRGTEGRDMRRRSDDDGSDRTVYD